MKNVQVDPFFNGFKIGGHRGAPKAFPENSMAGFRQVCSVFFLFLFFSSLTYEITFIASVFVVIFELYEVKPST